MHRPVERGLVIWVLAYTSFCASYDPASPSEFLIFLVDEKGCCRSAQNMKSSAIYGERGNNKLGSVLTRQQFSDQMNRSIF